MNINKNFSISSVIYVNDANIVLFIIYLQSDRLPAY